MIKMILTDLDHTLLKTDGTISERTLETLKKCREKGIGVLGPVVPPTPENLRKNIAAGYSMIILGNDMWHFQKALKELVANSVEPVRNEH